VRDQDEFGLSALIWTHPCISIGGVRFFGIHGQTDFCVTTMAIETEATGDIERQHDTIAFLDALNGISHFVDYTHDFVADDRSLAQRSTSVVHVKIAAAYSTRCDSELGIGGTLDLWLGVS
jgi:hypothetical protein